MKSHPTGVRGLKFHGGRGLAAQEVSHPTGVRGLKSRGPRIRPWSWSPSHPTGVRGLKSNGSGLIRARNASRPTGVRGLKLHERHERRIAFGRTPLGCVD